MAFDELMGLTNRLLAHALAALRAQLDRVLDEVAVREQLNALGAGERAVLLSFARPYLAEVSISSTIRRVGSVLRERLAAIPDRRADPDTVRAE